MTKKWGILIKKESESLIVTGLKIPRDYEYGQEEYDFSIRETQTYEIIEDVARLRSEIGILFLNDFNEAVINKILKSYDMRIGYITHRKGIISRLGNSYLEALMKYI